MKNKSCLALAAIAALSSQIAYADGGAVHQVKQTIPVKMGTSGGSASDASRAFCCGGTLGALVVRDGVLHILSNNHILARAGSATSLEDTIQPGLIDVGCRSANANIVGDFAGDIVPLGTANVDAALSVARSGMVDTTGYILDIGVPCSTTQAPTVGLAVMKSGRTTGFTTGSILSVNTSVSIQYQKGCNAGKKFTVSYVNQILTGPMSAGGDSGSLLVSNDGTPNPVALLYAGSSSTTIYNPVDAVISAFATAGYPISFVGNSCGATASGPGAAGVAVLSPAPDAMGRAHQTKVEHEFDLMKRPGVWGVGIGSAENDPTEPAIVIFLESPGGTIPPSIPRELDGTKVRVIFTDPFVAQ